MLVEQKLDLRERVMSNKAQIIQIIGYKGHGKTTLGGMLAKLLPKTKVLHFGDNLKGMLASAMDTTVQTIEESKGSGHVTIRSNRGLTSKVVPMRKMLQRFGTEVMKKTFGDDIWVRLLQDDIAKAEADGCEFIIIPDTRFQEEVLEDSIVIHIDTLVPSTDTHASETSHRDINSDVKVLNTGDLDRLHESAEGLVEIIRTLMSTEDE